MEHREDAPSGRATAGCPLNASNTFDNFVVGPSNRFAHAASMAVSRSPGREYNPLLVEAESGLGKTHLLHAICHQVGRAEPSWSVVYLTADEFVNTAGWSREALRSVDFLVLDDIHWLSGRHEAQEELFHVFNALSNKGVQMVMSSEKHPSEIEDLQPRLSSRLLSGLVAKVEAPNLETKAAIVRRKVAARGVTFPEDVVSAVVASAGSSIREIEGILNRLVGTSMLTGVPLDMNLARSVLGELYEKAKADKLQVLEAVSERFGVKVAEIKSKRRTRDVAEARHVAMWLCRRLTDGTLNEIGDFFGKDHSTVLYAIEKVQARYDADKTYKDRLDDVERAATAIARKSN